MHTNHRKSTHSNTSRNAADAQDSLISSVAALADTGHADEALKLLSSTASGTDELRNARAVCLLRLGRITAAVEMLRTMVIPPNCTWLRQELPVIYRTNFCTALLLNGHPSGAEELLNSIPEQSHPAVQRLHRQIVDWRNGLSLWQRIQFRIGLEPRKPVSLDDQIGDFVDPSVSEGSPIPGSPNPSGAVPASGTSDASGRLNRHAV